MKFSINIHILYDEVKNTISYIIYNMVKIIIKIEFCYKSYFWYYTNKIYNDDYKRN